MKRLFISLMLVPLCASMRGADAADHAGAMAAYSNARQAAHALMRAVDYVGQYEIETSIHDSRLAQSSMARLDIAANRLRREPPDTVDIQPLNEIALRARMATHQLRHQVEDALGPRFQPAPEAVGVPPLLDLWVWADGSGHSPPWNGAVERLGSIDDIPAQEPMPLAEDAEGDPLDRRNLFDEAMRRMAAENARGMAKDASTQALALYEDVDLSQSGYSEDAAEAFRDWLRNVYPSLDALNELWATRYVLFEDIEPPRTDGPAFGRPLDPHAMAFARFRRDSIALFHLNTARAVAETNPALSLVLPAPLSEDIRSDIGQRAVDPWLLGRGPWTSVAQPLNQRVSPEFIAARFPGRPWMLEAGADTDYAHPLAVGARGIVARNTNRDSMRAARIDALWNAAGVSLAELRPAESPLAILRSESTLSLGPFDGESPDLTSEILHRLIDAGWKPRLISETAIERDKSTLDSIEILVAPQSTHLSDSAFQKIVDWVERGGTYIAFGAVAAFDEFGAPRDMPDRFAPWDFENLRRNEFGQWTIENKRTREMETVNYGEGVVHWRLTFSDLEAPILVQEIERIAGLHRRLSYDPQRFHCVLWEGGDDRGALWLINRDTEQPAQAEALIRGPWTLAVDRAADGFVIPSLRQRGWLKISISLQPGDCAIIELR